MTVEPEADDVAKWHRKFAMSCNNRAWELSVVPRTPAQDAEMLSLAHASAWHWGQVGTELNQVRAKMLLAEVHALLGLGPSALQFAREIRQYFARGETPDWEIAFVHTVCAQAAFAAGESAEYKVEYAKALAALNAIGEPEDREVVAKSFRLVPAP